jgi:photosystem II stability/assembly factor-like uncharacterized protein
MIATAFLMIIMFFIITANMEIDHNQGSKTDISTIASTGTAKNEDHVGSNQTNITKVLDLTADCSQVVIPANIARDTNLDIEKELLTVYWYDESNGKDAGVVFRYTDPDCSVSARQVTAHLLGDIKPKITLNSIQMINETTGWAMSNRGVLRTENGWEQWEIVLSLDLGEADYDSPRFRPYFFMDSLHAWVAIGSGPIKIFRTLDGGETWKESMIEEQTMPKYLTFVNPNEGWFMISIDAFTGGQELIDIYQTRDGGSHWEKIAATYPNKELNNFPIAGMKSGLSFLNVNKGWASGYLTNVEGVPWLYQTDDGGLNWRQIELPPLSNFKESFISTEPPRFFDEKEGKLLVQALQPNHSEKRFHNIFYTTIDGGKTWVSTTPLETEGRIIHDFISTKKGWVVTAGILYSTDNGGQSWEMIEPNQEFAKVLKNETIKDIDFVNQQIGWALTADDTLFITKDGGNVWTIVIDFNEYEH